MPPLPPRAGRPPRLTGAALAVALVALSVAAPSLGLVPVARAAEVTDVASSFDPDNVFDFRFRAGYEYLNKTAAIKREVVGATTDQSGILVGKDLVFHQQRHTFDLRAEVGIFQDLALHVALPFVLDDQRSYEYDQRLGSACIYPGTSGGAPNCVNSTNSTTTNAPGVANAPGNTKDYLILPPGGADYQNGGMPFVGSPYVFRGVKRGGSGADLFDTINFGITWAALSQKRDDTKPTWTVGLEYKLSIGNIMSFDRERPDASHGVSDGLDHIVARTSVSHRFRYFDPYINFWFDYPYARRSDTLFYDLGAAAKNQAPQISAGLVMGFEGVAWERPKEQYKVAIDLYARISGKFDGRGYSELWEVLASSDALKCDPQLAWTVAWNPACGSQTTNKYQGKPYSGLTTIENYATIGAQAGLNVQAGKYVRFRLAYLYQHDQSHRITNDDVGKPDAASTDPCKAGAPGRVCAPNEFNPSYRPIINEVGRRYRVEGVDLHSVNVWGQVMF